MEQHRIKSALEIALEKAEKLGKFTEAEARQHTENQFRPAGEALARKLVAGMTARDAKIELGQLPPEAKPVVQRAALEHLVSLVDVSSPETAEPAAQGIEALTGQEKVQEAVRALLEDYHQAREARLRAVRPALERAARQELERAGFRGPAVQVALERSQPWRQTLSKLAAEYGQRLGQLREQLLRLPLPE